MDFLVSGADRVPISTESLDDETYPGLNVYEMTDAQKQAVSSARILINHLSPITSEDESDVVGDSGDDDNVSEVDELPNVAEIIPHVPVIAVPEIHDIKKEEITVQETLPTPHIFSKVPDDKILEELKLEVTQLRKKVALSANMKSLMSKLDGSEDITFKMEVIRSYSKRRFNIIITLEDFEALTQEQIVAMYTKTRESEKSDKFELIYKTLFDFGVVSLEKGLNKFFFNVSNLNQYLLYEDVSSELNNMKGVIESTVVGKYVDHTSPIIRILSYLVIQVTRAKFNV